MQALTGSRLREKRLALGMRQADLALRVGISPSYLNLIEHNRRRIAPELLQRLAQALGVQAAQLEEGAGGVLLEDLRAAAAEFQGLGAEIDRVEDFAGRFAGWAGLVSALHQRGLGLSRALEALNDRLSHDPNLSAALHDLLSMVSAVRATAAILAETPDLEPDWRERFLGHLNRDSERLARRAEGMVGFLDGTETPDARATVSPHEEVEAWLAQRGWDLGAVETAEGREGLHAEISGLASEIARRMAADFVDRAAQDAAVLPQAAFAQALADLGPDPARLAQRFGTGLLPVFRRLPLVAGPEVGLVMCDGSGTITRAKPVVGFSLPRFGATCPLWPLFNALARPMMPIEAVVETPAGRRFWVLAYAEAHYPEGFGGPELREAAMLILPAGPGSGAAGAQSGAQGLAHGRVVKLGPTCRICPRPNCPARREPSILSAPA